MQTLQDMLTVEDFDVSDAFQHSRSTESIKSLASESYMSKLNVAKRRSNQQETETFYFSVGDAHWPSGFFFFKSKAFTLSKIELKLEARRLLSNNTCVHVGLKNFRTLVTFAK